MTSIANRRQRITLMAEETTQGAGGRLITTTPVIADAWAEINESESALGERADHEHAPARIEAVVGYRQAYKRARRIAWRGVTYRITGLQGRHGGAFPTLTFEAKQLEGAAA